MGKQKVSTKKVKLTKEQKQLCVLSESLRESFIKLKKANHPIVVKWSKLPDPFIPDRVSVQMKAAERALFVYASFLEKMEELDNIDDGDLASEDAPYMAG